MMGLNVRRVKLKAYILDGFLCGVGSVLFCLNTLGGFVEQAKGFEMDAIASSVIGGTLLTGGVGNVFGTLFGVLIKATIEAFITFQGTLSSWWNLYHDRGAFMLLHRASVDPCDGKEEKVEILFRRQTNRHECLV